MHYHYNYFFGMLAQGSFVLLLAITTAHAQSVEHIPATNQYQVRVLLDSQEIGSNCWMLHASGGFIIYDRDDRTKKDSIASDTISVQCGTRGITINHKRYMSECIVIVPARADEPIDYDTHSYQGLFLVMRSKDKDKALLINRVELEDYVFSVLRTESFPGWPLEVNKVFAIACRSYAISMILNARKSSLPYHIRNTNHHQTYTGVHNLKHLRTAVNDTQGIFIAHNGKPVLAMFDICCGGIIPAHVTGFDFTKAPYLARTYACTFCKSCKAYQWQIFYSSEQLATLLKPHLLKITKVHDLRITKYDKAGLVKTATIHGTKTAVCVTGKRLYGLLKNIRSFCFTAHKQSDGIVFKGRGYGHHIGICQWGVREMERKGHDYRSILSFYYPQTTCVRLQYDNKAA